MAKRICVVGAGRWGRNHVRTLAELGALGGVVDVDERALAEVRRGYSGVETFAELGAALGRGFDGFVVASPAASRFEIARRILEAGRPALVEKPLSLCVREARALHELARSNGLSLMVGHVMLFHPAVRKIKEMISAGAIGRLQYLYSNRLNLGTVRTEENILWSFAPHDVSIFQHLIGGTPIEVVSRGGAFVQPGVHDTTMTVLSYPKNIVGHIFVSWLHPFKEHRLVVIGSKGMLTYEDSSKEQMLRLHRKGINVKDGEPEEYLGSEVQSPEEDIEFERVMPLTEELRHFVDHLGAPGPDIATAESAIEVLEILERATESLERAGPGTAGHGASSGGRAREGFSEARVERGDVFVHPTSVVDEDVKIGAGTKIWHFSHVQSGARIGRKCALGQNVNVGRGVRMGDFVRVQNNVSVYEGVELEDHVFCGPSMVFTNVRDPRSKYPKDGVFTPTVVRVGASLGANCTIVCGVTIGRHAFVGAGAVVTKDVADHAMVMGVPARRTGWVCECGARLPKRGKAMTCGRCGRRYRAGRSGLAAMEGAARGKPGKRRASAR